ncbi:MAG: hypothetical protein LBG19_10100 [Prevotellaceae bacterium]|nr:hypothetical protein [Prevotellaceae bacterium]
MLEKEIAMELTAKGGDFFCFIDIAELPAKQNKGYPVAILFGLTLTPGYLKKVADTPSYVKNRVENGFDFADDEFYLKELRAGEISDYLADYITKKVFLHTLSQTKTRLLPQILMVCIKRHFYPIRPLPQKRV